MFLIKEGYKKNMDISIFGSDPPIHPQNMDKNKKAHCVFGFLAHLEPKTFGSFSPSHPSLPPTGPIIC